MFIRFAATNFLHKNFNVLDLTGGETFKEKF